MLPLSRLIPVATLAGFVAVIPGLAATFVPSPLGPSYALESAAMDRTIDDRVVLGLAEGNTLTVLETDGDSWTTRVAVQQPNLMAVHTLIVLPNDDAALVWGTVSQRMLAIYTSSGTFVTNASLPTNSTDHRLALDANSNILATYTLATGERRFQRFDVGNLTSLGMGSLGQPNALLVDQEVDFTDETVHSLYYDPLTDLSTFRRATVAGGEDLVVPLPDFDPEKSGADALLLRDNGDLLVATREVGVSITSINVRRLAHDAMTFDPPIDVSTASAVDPTFVSPYQLLDSGCGQAYVFFSHSTITSDDNLTPYCIWGYEGRTLQDDNSLGLADPSEYNFNSPCFADPLVRYTAFVLPNEEQLLIRWSDPAVTMSLSAARVPRPCDELVSVPEADLTLSLRPHPVPWFGTSPLRFDVADFSDAGRARLFDVSGRERWAESIANVRTHQGFSPNMPPMAPGVYFLRVEDDARSAIARVVALR